jgi:hypothetical protein
LAKKLNALGHASVSSDVFVYERKARKWWGVPATLSNEEAMTAAKAVATQDERRAGMKDPCSGSGSRKASHRRGQSVDRGTRARVQTNDPVGDELSLAGHTLALLPMGDSAVVVAFGGIDAGGAYSSSSWQLELV